MAMLKFFNEITWILLQIMICFSGSNAVFTSTSDQVTQLAPQAEGLFTATYSRPTARTEFLNWRLNNVTQAQAAILNDNSCLTSLPVSADPRITFNCTRQGSVYYMVMSLHPIFLNDSNTVIDVFQNPDNVVLGTVTTVNVAVCNSSIAENFKSSTSCDFNCVAILSCTADTTGTSVNATCRANATWDVTPVCEESTTVEPTTVSTYTATQSSTGNDLESTVSAVSTVKFPSSLEPTVNPDLTTSPDVNAGDTSTGGGKGDGLSDGEIAGIVIGVLVGVGLIAGGIIVYIKKTA